MWLLTSLLCGLPDYLLFVPFIAEAFVIILASALFRELLTISSRYCAEAAGNGKQARMRSVQSYQRLTTEAAGAVSRLPEQQPQDEVEREEMRRSFFAVMGLLSSRLAGPLRAILYYGLLLAFLYWGVQSGFCKQVWDALRLPVDGEPRYGGFSGVFLSVMAVAFISEAYSLFGYAIARYPDIVGGRTSSDEEAEDEEAAGFRNDPSFTRRIGVIVPCHKSEEEIRLTLESLMVHVPAENIVVADNSSHSFPPDATLQAVKDCDSRVKYIYIAEGRKTRAMWEAIREMPPHVDYLLHIDDDTIIPEDFVFDPSHFLDDKISGVSYGIEMMGPSLSQRCVDYEFKLWSHWRYFRSCFSTAWFCHGIIGLWRRDRFVRILKDHPFLPFGEDGWIGCINMLYGWKMKQDLRCSCRTFAPSNFTPHDVLCYSTGHQGTDNRVQGYGAGNIWKQRGYRWYVNAPRRVFLRLWLFAFYDAGSFSANFYYRIELTRHLLSIALHLLLPLLLIKITYDKNWHYFALARVSFYVLELVHGIIINSWLWRHRPDVQMPLYVVVCYPIYSDFLRICKSYAHWRCVLYYIPFFPMRIDHFTVISREEKPFEKAQKQVEAEEMQMRRGACEGAAAMPARIVTSQHKLATPKDARAVVAVKPCDHVQAVAKPREKGRLPQGGGAASETTPLSGLGSMQKATYGMGGRMHYGQYRSSSNSPKRSDSRSSSLSASSAHAVPAGDSASRGSGGSLAEQVPSGDACARGLGSINLAAA